MRCAVHLSALKLILAGQHLTFLNIRIPAIHICQHETWVRALARGIYETDTLKEDGFIHLSYPRQVVSVANYLYRQQKDLLLLCIDPDKVQAGLKVEALGTTEPFPHLYGPLNLEAVVKVLEFPSNQDGTFTLPDL